MTQTPRPDADALRRLSGRMRLTRAGMVAERFARAFWPVWTLLATAAALLALDAHSTLAVEAFWAVATVWSGGLAWALWRGLREFRWPTREQAIDRMDALLPGRPLAALRDTQAIGDGDDASRRLWQAHLERMAARAAAARPVQPDLRLSRRDPYGLRYVAATAFGMALLFGSFWRLAEPAALMPGAPAADSGPAWEGWAEPPAYTGKPGIYLNDVPAGPLELPEGSRITLRLYGEIGDLTLAETVSARTGDAGSAAEPAQEFEVLRPGTIAISGEGGRSWDVRVLADGAPQVSLGDAPEVAADGEMALGFAAEDDNGVVSGRAQITLALDRVDRRFGLTAAPEPREPLVVDLPMPLSGSRRQVEEALIENFSEHPWANLPVTIRLEVEDARGQTGQSDPLDISLPGRRFFHPLAAALIEMRRDLLWTRENGSRSLQVLRAVTNQPEGFITNERAYLMIRVFLRRLDSALSGGLTPEARDEFAAVLWDIALQVEEGDLEDAKARLERAQERLAEAIRNGASQAEIDQLMRDLSQAMDDYVEQLAQKSDRESQYDNADNSQQQMEITGDQIQQMMDEIQRLMEEGRMAEAQALLEQLNQLMENLQVTQGEGGQGSGPGQQAMRDLGETLRDQQGLADETFQDLQNGGRQPQGRQGAPQQGEGQQGEEGQPGQEGQTRPGEGEGRQGQDGAGQQDGRGQGSLADRQQALRQEVERQRGRLPGAGSDSGDAARRSLDRAGRAMTDAERALRRGDGQSAIDRQADAMDALRDGLRELGEAMAENGGQQPGQQPGDQVFGRGDANGQRDPLGREIGDMGQIGSDQQMLQGEDVYRRARDLLDEIRRRSGERSRPEAERSYLERLLDSF